MPDTKISAAACSLITMLSGVMPQVAQADAGLAPAVMWNARFGTLRGNTECSYGDPDCNRCVYDVRSQFEAMAQEGQFVESVNTWKWRDRTYAPAQENPSEVFTVLPGSLGVESGSHFQSIVRSQSASPNLFATYGGSPSGIFMSDSSDNWQSRLDGGSLDLLYRGATTHPGGMAAVGEHLLVASDGDQPILEFLDISRVPAPSIGAPMPVHMANVGAAQLASGGYLMVTTTTSKENAFRMWYTASLANPHVEEIWPEPTAASWQPDVDGYHGFENISLVTECGTGQLYMIGANGTPDVSDDNKGVWALYRLTAQRSLQFVARNTIKMHGAACNTRASGSAFAGKHGELMLYCQQKGQQANQRVRGIR